MVPVRLTPGFGVNPLLEFLGALQIETIEEPAAVKCSRGFQVIVGDGPLKVGVVASDDGGIQPKLAAETWRWRFYSQIHWSSSQERTADGPAVGGSIWPS